MAAALESTSRVLLIESENRERARTSGEFMECGMALKADAVQPETCDPWPMAKRKRPPLHINTSENTHVSESDPSNGISFYQLSRVFPSLLRSLQSRSFFGSTNRKLHAMSKIDPSTTAHHSIRFDRLLTSRGCLTVLQKSSDLVNVGTLPERHTLTKPMSAAFSLKH
jgi:hypothetical protein